MFRRILVAVDGSEPANEALATTLKLAKGQRARLRIVHIADTLPPAAVGETYVDVDAYREAAMSVAREVVKEASAKARAAGVPAESAVVEIVSHDASGAIVDDAKRWRADLIALGTHGRTGLARLFLGSVAEGVARHAPVAVLLIRGGATPGRRAAPRRVARARGARRRATASRRT